MKNIKYITDKTSKALEEIKELDGRKYAEILELAVLDYKDTLIKRKNLKKD